MEQAETVEDDVLEKVAGISGVSSEFIKNYSDEAVIYNIQNNYEGSNNHGANIGQQFNFNPIEKIVALYDEKVALLERLLPAEKEKNKLLKGNK